MKKLIVFIFVFSQIALTAQSGLVGEYYNGENFETKVLTRIDKKIDFAWWEHSPHDGVINRDHYSIRWTGKLVAPETGKYLFSAKVDDGIRLWVNGLPLINSWEYHDMGDFSNSINLETGVAYNIKVEYFNGPFEGEITLLWQTPSQVNRPDYNYKNFNPIPENYLFQPSYNPPKIPEKNTVLQNLAPPLNKKNSLTFPTVKPPKKHTQTIRELDADLDVKQVFFIKSLDKMTDNSIERLDKVATFLRTHLKATVVLKGHTDPVGNSELNMELSVSRAKAVADYLKSKNIDENRIRFEGYGSTEPLNRFPKTEEEHAINRRVEFIIINNARY